MTEREKVWKDFFTEKGWFDGTDLTPEFFSSKVEIMFPEELSTGSVRINVKLEVSGPFLIEHYTTRHTVFLWEDIARVVENPIW